jgi:chromate reductase
MSMINVLALSGSLRKDSYNTAALRAAQELAPANMAIELFDIASIPLYNEDVHAKGFPASVEDFRNRIQAADAVLIATPEYNYSVPGVLKNAIDWASRPPKQPFDGKPMAIFSASPSMLGGARAQYHLRQCFIYLNGLIMNQPEVMIASAHEKFDAQGRLTDPKTREFLGKLLGSLASWTEKQRG